MEGHKACERWRIYCNKRTNGLWQEDGASFRDTALLRVARGHLGVHLRFTGRGVICSNPYTLLLSHALSLSLVLLAPLGLVI